MTARTSLLLLLLAPFLFSLAAFSPSAAQAAGADQASKYIERLATQTLNTISDKNLGKEQKQTRLERIFADNVDTAWVGRFVMGRNWKQLAGDQQRRYLSAYQSFILRHYAARFSEYTSGRFKITGSKDTGDDEFTVSMEMAGDKSSDEPVLIDYRLRRNGGGFKVFDIIIEGVSMITTQRAEFASVISEHDVDYLIKQLETRSIGAPDKK